ncbi:MAG: DUF427 domain-containing protein [Deltaproteobacteria bacterium]|nr:DUF427 domain-containing protein [Deltaproteobacteria bacterium]
MARAIWNGVVVAESETFEVVEGNVYFPKESLKREYLEDSSIQTTCFWKGRASYYTLNVDGKKNSDAAWYYPKPSIMARKIKDHVAFWKGVQIER